MVTKEGKTIDIKNVVASIDIYEDLLCPCLSAKIVIVSAGGSIEDESGELTTLYEGAKIRGGELVRIAIDPNSGRNLPIDLTLYVRSVSEVTRDDEKEFFTIDLVSREAIINEGSFVQKIYGKDIPLSTHVQDIIGQYFPEVQSTVDETANNFGFSGNQMKAFEALVMLASKAVPKNGGGESSSGLDATAGYFFYQTRDGFQFRSIDALISQDVKGKFFKTDQVISSYTEGEIADCKIEFFDVKKNQDLVDMLKKGAYSTDRRYFDPNTFTVDSPKLGSIYSGKDYVTQGATNLGVPFDPSELNLSESNFSFTDDFPTLIETATYDLGTFTGKEVKTERNFDISQVSSQKKMRYNTLFTQIIKVQLPLNSYLFAGDLIEITVPKITSGDSKDIDTEQVSGVYMIEQVCHHYDPVGSFTSLAGLRDTYGLYGRNKGTTSSPITKAASSFANAVSAGSGLNVGTAVRSAVDLTRSFF